MLFKGLLFETMSNRWLSTPMTSDKDRCFCETIHWLEHFDTKTAGSKIGGKSG